MNSLPPSTPPSRRRILRAAGGTLAAAGLAAPRAFAANDKISVACIGIRGRGNSVMQSFVAEPDCEITHLCDVREAVLTQRGAEIKAKTGKMPKLVRDYRDLLTDPTIDAFMVATPDHWHALLTIEGCLAGKDVYVEKPASHNIQEGKVAVAAARKGDRMVQMGTQIRSAAFLKEARDFVASGALGKVISGKAWETARVGAVKLAADGTPPAGIDYHLWQGPSPERAYNETIVGGAWRWLFDYGTGDLGNDGVHRIDYCRYVMGLDDWPEAITSSGGKYFFEDDQQWPDTLFVTYDYPGAVLQYEMRLWSKSRLFNAGEGATIYGENGWMLLTNTSWKAYDPDGKIMKEGSSDGGQQAHVRNFLDAVRSRKRESLNQEILSGHISTVMCHAGNIAWRTGKKLRFDPKTETFDDAEANALVGREHRKGFELPKIA
ncbi:MAG: Gfo/Idh/MocA family oxidoreductase [Verrucomicrobiales bacterium]|nr:Gfo/Idh/MocA family oxidoreductase [Verrucomicrobiales bacterium]